MSFKRCFAVCLILLVSCAPTMKDFPKLQEKLGSSDKKTRISSIKKIGKIKDASPEVPQILYGVLKSDPSASVRAESAMSLMNLGRSESIVPLSEALNNDTEPIVRSACAEALYHLSGYDSLDILISALNRDNSPLVRAKCVKFIGKIGGERASEEIQMKLKNDLSAGVRTQAATSLGDLKDMNSFELLKNSALNDPGINVREAAVIAIGSIPGRASMNFLCEALEMPNLTDMAIDSIHINKRGGESRRAISYLLQIADSSYETDHRILKIFLTSNDSRVNSYFCEVIRYHWGEEYRYIVSSLVKKEDTSLVPELIRDLEFEKHFSYQVNIVKALGDFKDSRSVPILMVMLTNRYHYHNGLAKHLMRSLGQIGDMRVWAYLCHLHCNDEDKDIRDDAGSALHELDKSYWNNKAECKCEQVNKN